MKSRACLNHRLSWVVIAAATAQLLSGAVNARADDLKAVHPSWERQTLGRVELTSHGDLRRGRQRYEYRMNEEGVIEGKDFIELVNPVPYSAFLKSTDGRPALYNDYLQHLEDGGMAALILNRIIDHEAMKRGIPPEVPEARVQYIFRGLLTQNGADTGDLRFESVPWMDGNPCGSKQKTDPSGKPAFAHAATEDASLRSNDEMYGWLKKRFGNQPVHLVMDWTYDEGGMAALQKQIHRKPDVGWPGAQGHPFGGCSKAPDRVEQGVEVDHERLPETWQEFRTRLKAQMQFSYWAYVRDQMWQQLVAEKNGLLSWQAMTAVTPDQLERMYRAMRDAKMKIQVENFDAEVTDIRVTGPKSAEFAKRFRELLDEAAAKNVPQIRAALAGAESEAANQRIQAEIDRLRASVPTQVYRQTMREFASEIAAKQVRTHLSSKSFRKAGQGTSEPPGFEGQEQRIAMNQHSFLNQLLPSFEGVDERNGLRIMIPAGVKELAPSVVTVPDPGSRLVSGGLQDGRARAILGQRIQAKLKAKAYRDTAYELFRHNKFTFEHNFCEDGDWPCSNADSVNAPRMLAEALFPETLYPGMSLPKMGTNQPAYSSTLGHDEWADRVKEISLELFENVITVPNLHVDRDLLIHNY
jgi:hypothetical protein